VAAAIRQFEDFIAWRKARELAVSIYHVSGEGSFARDFGLRDQIRRAAVSIMSNIAEGFERGSSAEFHHFVCIAKASCAELRSQFYIALDVNHVDREQFERLMALATEVGRLLGGLRIAVARRRDST
jgi:four helix bundle protein